MKTNPWGKKEVIENKFDVDSFIGNCISSIYLLAEPNNQNSRSIGLDHFFFLDWRKLSLRYLLVPDTTFNIFTTFLLLPDTYLISPSHY